MFDGLPTGMKDCIEGLGVVARTGSVWMMYIKFGRDFSFILALTVAIMSATYLGLGCLCFLLVGGWMLAVPLLGFGVIIGTTVVSCLLFYHGLFPWNLFFKMGGGIAAPFLYVGSIR
jgi:hypothetical protein